MANAKHFGRGSSCYIWCKITEYLTEKNIIPTVHGQACCAAAASGPGRLTVIAVFALYNTGRFYRLMEHEFFCTQKKILKNIWPSVRDLNSDYISKSTSEWLRKIKSGLESN